MDRLVGLPGVGRKTANVVLGTAFGLATGVVVDTHVGRLSRRLGLSREKDPAKVERDLMAVLPRREWIDFSHRMIRHGRQVCSARRPRCSDCSMHGFCPKIGVEVWA
jgi:endonuclease-3